MILSRISIKVLSSVIFSVVDVVMGDEEDDGVLLSRNERLLMRETGDARAVFRSSKRNAVLFSLDTFYTNWMANKSFRNLFN